MQKKCMSDDITNPAIFYFYSINYLLLDTVLQISYLCDVLCNTDKGRIALIFKSCDKKYLQKKY